MDNMSREFGPENDREGVRVESGERESKRKIAIVVLGRGVGIRVEDPKLIKDSAEQMKIIEEVRSGRGDLIEPTGYLEKAVLKDPTKGDFGPEQHPKFNFPVDPAHEPRGTRYAGAMANIEATKVLIQKLANDSNRKLERIYFAAGRTPDMNEYAPEGWTQGMVLAKSLLKDGVEEELKDGGVIMVFEPENVNTWDDIVASFIDAQKQGCEEVMVVTVSLHQERTELMVREAMEGMIKVYGEKNVFNVRMVPSELLLLNNEEQFTKMRDAMFTRSRRRTKAERVTSNREKKGINQMMSGTYKSQWADGGKIHEFNKPVQEMTVEEVVNFR